MQIGQKSGASSSVKPESSEAALLAQSCGTAVASVCAIGLFQIEELLGGPWSVAAVFVAAAGCLLLAQRIGRLATVIPSAAGFLAQLSRGLGRELGMLLVIPYLLLTLFLVGSEATLAGVLIAEVSPLPAPVGALLLLVTTWALCRAGRRIGITAQAAATWTLMAGLALLSIIAVGQAARAGVLGSQLVTTAPTPLRFFAGVGQALFLFMGFELITFQPASVGAPQLARTLRRSVVVLALFYAVVALGFCCLREPPRSSGGFFVPQLAMARQAGGTAAAWLVVGLSLLASYTSFNGALLALSRFTQALASQGMLPARLTQLDPRTLVPGRALDSLLVLCLVVTAVVASARLLQPSILAAAVAVAFVYAGVAVARERPPFREPDRRRGQSIAGLLLAGTLVILGVGVVVDAGDAGHGGYSGATAVLNAPWAVRGLLLGLLGLAYGAAMALIGKRRWQIALRPPLTDGIAVPNRGVPGGLHGR